MSKMQFDRYDYYIEAVQSVEHDVDLYTDLYQQVFKKKPVSLREDFCGTHALSCEWVKRGPTNTALALDLDPEPLEYGRTHAETTLTEDQHRRLQVQKKNVISQSRPADLIVAGNFSYFIFKRRELLRQYFKKAHQSLRKNGGLFVLDIAGGSSMVELGEERRTIRCPRLGRYTYIWECQAFDPVTHEGQFGIHFEIPTGQSRKIKIRNAFTYDWRLWSIPETRELLHEAGFKKTLLFWDVAKAKDDEKYRPVDSGANHEAWIAYVAGVK